MSEDTPKPEVVGYRCPEHGLVGFSHVCGATLECLVMQSDYKRLQADFETLDYQYSEAINKAIPAIEAERDAARRPFCEVHMPPWESHHETCPCCAAIKERQRVDTERERIKTIIRDQRLSTGSPTVDRLCTYLLKAIDDGPEPGELIAEVNCPICGAGLTVEHGDDEGEIGVLASDSLTTPGTLAYAKILLKEWRNTPFFENREDWERWVADFGGRVDEVLK